ncbi:MAG TPA: response regulator transcription factor [Candidatus Sulfotelmatobacter sp.]
MSYAILIVDDSAAIRRSLRSWLECSNDIVVCGEAEYGRIGVEKVKELQPDVVILDLQMPVMNGLEAAHEIADIAPHTAMVLLTLHHYEQLKDQAKAAGIKEVLSKDEAIPHQLLASIKKICECTPGSRPGA